MSSTNVRVRAPELIGQVWLNTAGRAYSLQDLRGKVVLLDFWTFCCINCLHVLDELRPLEERYGDVLVTIGVHSPKFEHEKDPAAVSAAVERYGVRHPVLNDPDMNLWQRYAVRAWPTLCVVDPEGYLVATMAGEGHAAGLTALLDSLVEQHEANGTLHRGEGLFTPPPPESTDLRFPGKALATPDGGFLVSSSAHHQIVALDKDFNPISRYGDGHRGHLDGRSDARFNEPQGLCALPPQVAETAGYDVVVADTVNHLLRGLRRSDGTVTTVAGTGRPWRSTVDFHAHDALSVDLSSPWDLAWYGDRVIIAMAGIHQLWWFDPARRTVGCFAGTTVEALRDGPLEQAWMAQPSGLSTGGERLWVVDSESSALRFVENDALFTAVGQGLFDFGNVDGAAADALFQHPLGVCALPDGSALVADTYNGAVRRFKDGQVSTVATGLAEPSDIVLDAEGGIVVVESGAHRLTRLAPGAARATGGRFRTERPKAAVRSGPVTLTVMFTPAPGQKLDDSFGPPLRLEISASPPDLLVEGAGVSTELTRGLVLADGVDGGVLQVVAQAATCDATAEFPACHLTRQDWGLPIRIDPSAPAELSLSLFAAETR